MSIGGDASRFHLDIEAAAERARELIKGVRHEPFLGVPPNRPWVWVQVIGRHEGWVPDWVAQRLGCNTEYGLIIPEPAQMAALRQTRHWRDDWEFDDIDDDGEPPELV